MGRFVTVRVWHEDRYAADCGAESAQWASAFMGFPCRIVKAVEPVAGPRVSDSGWVRAGFADAEPALVISTASLDDLNTRLTEALPMNRFRPNLVVSFVPAYSEDRWATVRIGDVSGARIPTLPEMRADDRGPRDGHKGKGASPDPCDLSTGGQRRGGLWDERPLRACWSPARGGPRSSP